MHVVIIDGLRSVIGFIEHLRIVATSNYSHVANSHTMQSTTSRTESSQSAVSSPMSSASVLTFKSNFLFLWLPSRDWT
jgi:hypothetical protein